jgi:predicted nucleic acid-binding protein
VSDLADTSAWVVARRRGGVHHGSFTALVLGGQIATCDAVRMELLRGARNAAELAGMRAELDALPDCAITGRSWRRAMWVQERLAHARGGRHRAVPPTDLLVAAAAEARGVAVLHHDRHFDEIAAVTGQAMRWI